MRIAARFATPTYTLFRVVVGLLFACHGGQKLLGLFGGTRMTAPMMVAAGLLAPFAAFIASGEMAVAYFHAHAPHALWPIVNHGELAVLYCFAFLLIAATGSGAWSLDAAFRRRRAGR